LEVLEAEAAQPDFWNDQSKAQRNIASVKAERAILDPFDALSSALDDASIMLELAEAGEEGALQEAADELEKVESGFQALEMQSLLGGEFDANNA
jgi:peptide chain release factor 2